MELDETIEEARPIVELLESDGWEVTRVSVRSNYITPKIKLEDDDEQ